MSESTAVVEVIQPELEVPNAMITAEIMAELAIARPHPREVRGVSAEEFIALLDNRDEN